MGKLVEVELAPNVVLLLLLRDDDKGVKACVVVIDMV